MRRKSAPGQTDGFDAPGGLTAFDAFADVFTPPEDLKLSSPKTVLADWTQDARNIRGYFQKALAALGLEKTAP